MGSQVFRDPGQLPESHSDAATDKALPYVFLQCPQVRLPDSHGYAETDKAHYEGGRLPDLRTHATDKARPLLQVTSTITLRALPDSHGVPKLIKQPVWLPGSTGSAGPDKPQGYHSSPVATRFTHVHATDKAGRTRDTLMLRLRFSGCASVVGGSNWRRIRLPGSHGMFGQGSSTQSPRPAQWANAVPPAPKLIKHMT